MQEPAFVEELVPEGSVGTKVPLGSEPSNSDEELYLRTVRRRIRYWMFRLRTEANEDRPADGLPEGLKSFYEDSEHFDGWENFATTWDVTEQNPLVTTWRFQSVEEEYEQKLEAEIRKAEIEARKRRRRAKKEK